jgi:hypothetical protein
MEGAATSLEDVNNNDENLDCFEYTGDNTKACAVAVKAKRSWIVLIIIIRPLAFVVLSSVSSCVSMSSAAVGKEMLSAKNFGGGERTIFTPKHQK